LTYRVWFHQNRRTFLLSDACIESAGPGSELQFLCKSCAVAFALGLTEDRCCSGVVMKKLGKFEIIQKVGQGAMGVVYKARDPMIDRIVALKTLTTGLAEDPNLLKRFYSEARAAGNLRHPNIVTIYELGHEGPIPFIAMQFLNGESLDKLIDRLPDLPLSQKVGFVVHVCRALDYAHKQTPPVIHRDVKPGNVMVAPDGSVVVVDFGIARLGESTLSQSQGLLIGTLGYMSPQLFRGATADARSDIWATGVMFYELLAYRRPFKGDSAAALMSSIVLDEPPPLTKLAPGIPQEIQAIVDRMLAKEVDARYQSMEEALAELEPIWRNLLQSDIRVLLESSQRYFDEGDLLAARSEIVQILHWDPANTEAKKFSDKVNAEIRRQQVFPQVKARVETAQKLLAEGKNDEAKLEAEAALKLDSSFPLAREIVKQANVAIERQREIAKLIRSSRERLAEGALTDAETQLDRVLSLDPVNTAARDQRKELQAERARRERRKRRDNMLQRARTLWMNVEYEQCIQLLLTADKEFPEDEEVHKFLDTARRDQLEQQRQAMLAEIRRQLTAQEFERALQFLESFLEQYPSDRTAENLRTHAVEGHEQQKRELRLKDGKDGLRKLLREKQFQKTIARGEDLQREFQSDFELSELMALARSEQEQLERKTRLDESLETVKSAMKAGRFFEAIQLAEKALLGFPKNAELLGLLDAAKKESAEKERQAVLKQRLREVERMLQKQQLTEAIDLARHTITTAGPDLRLSDILHKAEKEREFREDKRRQQEEALQRARSMLEQGKLLDATALLNEAVEAKLFAADDARLNGLQAEIAAQQKITAAEPLAPDLTLAAGSTLSPPSGDPAKDYVYTRRTPLAESTASEQNAAAAAVPQKSGEPIEPPASVPPPPALLTSSTLSSSGAETPSTSSLPGVEKHLATFMGPVARIVVRRAAAKAKTPEGLVSLLADALSTEKDRKSFLAKRDRILEEIRKSQPFKQGVTPVGSVPGDSSWSAEVTPAVLRHAAELLARRLGPVAPLLTQRAAQRAKNVLDLYVLLSQHLDDPAERGRFLSESGFPQK
jgi:eukaryotic-like serine/threonine-protein kinase